MFKVDKQCRLIGKEKPQCCVLDSDGDQCQEEAYRVEMYHGNPKWETLNPMTPKWCLVPMCKPHSEVSP